MNKRAFGADGEAMACGYLIRHGWRILDRNVRIGRGEIDIIAQKRGLLRRGLIAFVEVKRRTDDRFGTPAEAVDENKRNRIVGTAALYLQRQNLPNADIRFDVIEITPEGIRHIENAFDATDIRSF